MAESFILMENGDFIEKEDATGRLLLESSAVAALQVRVVGKMIIHRILIILASIPILRWKT